MENIILNPKFVRELLDKKKPALLLISKAKITFNSPATRLVALKEGSQFIFTIKNSKLYYSFVTKEGFEIKQVNNSECAELFDKGIYNALLLKFMLPSKSKSFKFEIGSFKEGLWELVPYSKN